jgi:hypothetical protein
MTDSSTAEAGAAKRKRSPVEETVTRPPPPAPSAGHPGNVTQINYLVRAKLGRLRLIEGDSEVFGDILGMIDDYEGLS